MSAILELFLEVVFEAIVGFIQLGLELTVGEWFGSFEVPDTKVSRIFLSILIVALGGVVWWELR